MLSSRDQLALLQAVLERGASVRMKMLGHSMTPCIRNGDIVVVAPTNEQELEVGDIVAFSLGDPGRLVVHRVVDQIGSGWLACGDNCQKADGVLSGDRIVGKVVKVQRGGREIRLGVLVGRKPIAILSRLGVLKSIIRRVRCVRSVISKTVRPVSK